MTYVDEYMWLEMLDGGGDPGEQASAPHRHQHGVHVGYLLHDLQPHGPLARHYVRVVVTGDKRTTISVTVKCKKIVELPATTEQTYFSEFLVELNFKVSSNLHAILFKKQVVSINE